MRTFLPPSAVWGRVTFMFHLLKLLIMRASVCVCGSVQRNATANEESFAVAAVGRPLRSINLHKVNAPRQEQEQG